MFHFHPLRLSGVEKCYVIYLINCEIYAKTTEPASQPIAHSQHKTSISRKKGHAFVIRSAKQHEMNNINHLHTYIHMYLH